MNELRLAGGAALCLASCGAGLRSALGLRRQAEQLAQLRQSFALMRCEIDYGKTPLKALCERLKDGCTGAVGSFYAALGENLPQAEAELNGAVERALTDTPAFEPTEAALGILRQLLYGFGQYGSAEQSELLALSCQKLDMELERVKSQLPARVRCRALLGVSTGLSLFLLVI